jgi:hypothetical protein
VRVETGSFRDPTSRVFYDGGRVLRGLDPEAARIDKLARQSGLIDRLINGGVLVENWRVDGMATPATIPSAAVVESRRLPVISHPGEWSFPMLRDAALLTLDANLAALKDGFILKDASAFNVVFDGVRPVVLDVASLDLIENHPTWTAYGQFVDHFLSPLMLEAYTAMPFQSVLSTSVIGFPVVSLDLLLRGRRRYRPGVTTHVRLRSRFERSADSMATSQRSAVASVSLPAEAIESTIRKIRGLVSKLESPNVGRWEGYESALPYSNPEVETKAAFVERAARRIGDRRLALDVGANEGLFTRILANEFETVAAIDVDPGVSGALYTSLRSSESNNVTPLAVDISNPSPSFGFRGNERRGFVERVRPSMSMWLAVVHHLCIGQGIPLPEIVDLIAATSAESIVEFVGPSDPMVQRISASRPASLDGYGLREFESLLNGVFDIVEVEAVSSSRTMYQLVRASR